MNERETKKLFFAFEIDARWPSKLPEGRALDESARHMTLAFLGEQEEAHVKAHLPEMPQPGFTLGPSGIFDDCLFFPERTPHCVAWHIQWLTLSEEVVEFQERLFSWLEEQKLVPSKKKQRFTPHVTVCRPPFKVVQWKKAFTPVPLACKALHLYESLGHSQYHSSWHYPFTAPFTEIDHTADLAFCIRGRALSELFTNAQLALTFHFPELIRFCIFDTTVETFEDVVSSLNQLIARADIEIGSPLKAVSYHGDVKQHPDKLLEWEMIVDV